jgi:hypothetical protein
MTPLTGKQRYRQIRVKNRILAERAMREFLAGKITVLPCSMDVQDELICREFDRMQQELRAALVPKP